MFMTSLFGLQLNSFVLDIFLAILFLFFVIRFLLKNKKNVKFDRMIFPFLYAFLYRGVFGIKWMKKFVKKHKEGVRLFGLIGIGIGFLGIFLSALMLFYVAWQIIFQPKVASVAPFLPFTEVPVLGYISFSHWVITIFIVVLIHEAAHGLVAISHGLKIKKTGFGLFAIFIPFLPVAFVEPDEEELKSSPDYVQYSIFSAGPMANFLLMIPLGLILLLIINPVESGITEDLGFSFNTIENETYPAFLAGIPSNVPFNYINNDSVYSMKDFYSTLIYSKPNQNLTLSYFNESSGKFEYNYSVTLIANPDGLNSGFLGVNQIHDYRVVKDEFEFFGKFFSWFKGLINLLFQITFSLGLINLFPAVFTDGGRMFSLALSKVSKNKKLNSLIVSFLGIFFLVLIIFSMITHFTGNPFSAIFG